MKNLTKYLYILFLVFATFTTNAQCWFTNLTTDLANASEQFKSFIKTNDDAFMVYKNIYNARGANAAFRLDVSLLQKVAVLRKDATFMQRIGGEIELEKIINANVRARCKSCGNAGASYLKHIDEYLDDVQHFVNNYNDVEGFTNVLTDIKRINSSGSPNLNVEGTAFMLRLIKEKQTTFLGKITKFEGSIDDLENGCKYDLFFTNGTKATFGEFKSYSSTSLGNLLKTDGATYQQFMTYIGKIKSIDELHYYFDIGKITDINVIKNRFKNVFESNKVDIFNKMKPEFRTNLSIRNINDFDDAKISEIINNIIKLQ